ncbi:MAG: hypothetical protein H6765_01975 [Candidatus Peribacteria bacterium]|nr:MAG: hypothetical protein H6765_01975 [Candidatus Peribacteria bacterium]
MFRTDFSHIGRPEEVMQQLQQGGRSLNMLEILKAVTGNIKASAATTKKVAKSNAETVQLADGETATVLEDAGDIEILEIADEPVVVASSGKLRPNDKVNVKYADGRIEYDVKYKKVKAEIESGEAELV